MSNKIDVCNAKEVRDAVSECLGIPTALMHTTVEVLADGTLRTFVSWDSWNKVDSNQGSK